MVQKVVAVSGGVDSMVLLSKLCDQYDPSSLVVAHFDHGIRDDSREDAAFVRMTVKQYGCLYEMRREELGAQASEELARDRRYAFLFDMVKKYDAPLVTAHHLDDLVETIALNIQRGTGWRGLTPFSRAIERPLLSMEKREIIAYAQKHKITWREDSTNTDTRYARNQIRLSATRLPVDTKRQLLSLYVTQRMLRDAIEEETRVYVGKGNERNRYDFIMLPQKVQLEAIRQVTRGRLTRPQCARLALRIATARPRTRYQAGSFVEVQFTTRTFTVELLK